MHAFFRDGRGSSGADGGFGAGDQVDGGLETGDGAPEPERVNFPDFVRVLAHFRPLKKNASKNKLNSREEKLRCE